MVGRTKPDPQQVAIHNNVTRTIIIGILAQRGGAALPAGEYVQAAEEIMNLIKRRGYEPQIRNFNQLKDGTHV